MKTILAVTLFTLVSLFGIAILGTASTTEVLAAENSAGGKEIFLAQKCNICHSVPAAGIEGKTSTGNMKGPDLPSSHTDPAWLAAFLKQQQEGEAGRHKRPFKGSDEELQTLVDWLLEQR